MPLPLGHSAIGLAAHELLSKEDSSISRWKVTVFAVILANLPDMDVVFGLISQGNGNAFHRGPTHSIIFALIAGYLFSNGWRAWSQIPKINFSRCFLLIFSHVLADFFFSSSPVSFLWPLETNWAEGFSSLRMVLESILFRSFQDAGIVMSCAAAIVFTRFFRDHSSREKPSVARLQM